MVAGDHLLEVDGLQVSLGGSRILQGVGFQVRRGGVTALLGRNGVGKTTTIRALMGLVPRSGRIRLEGIDLVRLPTHRIAQAGVGYVPEDREVFAGLSVGENLRLAERKGRPDYELVFRLFPELETRRGQAAGTLSGGQQQMVAIARALLNRNRILLVDEPTKGLSPLYVSRVAEALAEAATRTTILLVEQNVAVARRLAAEAVVLDQGQVVYTGAIDALLDDHALARRHLGVSR